MPRGNSIPVFTQKAKPDQQPALSLRSIRQQTAGDGPSGPRLQSPNSLGCAHAPEGSQHLWLQTPLPSRGPTSSMREATGTSVNGAMSENANRPLRRGSRWLPRSPSKSGWVPTGIFPEFIGWKSGRLCNSLNSHRLGLLVARESRGLASESFPATCRWVGPAVPGYRRSRGLWTWGSGGWALQDIMFLAPVGGNTFHVFPRVYRAKDTECSLWPRKPACRGLAPRVGPDQCVRAEAGPDRCGLWVAPCGGGLSWSTVSCGPGGAPCWVSGRALVTQAPWGGSGGLGAGAARTTLCE